MRRVMMIVASFFLLSVAGCTYKTCPTYTKKVKKTQKERVQVQVNDSQELTNI